MYETNVRAADLLAAESDSWRQHKQIFDIYNLYRIVLGLILLISFYFRDITTTLGAVDDTLFVRAGISYFIVNALSLLPRIVKLSRVREKQFFVAILIIDILTLVVISYTCGGVSSGMAHLLIVPVATSSIIFDTRMSTFFA